MAAFDVGTMIGSVLSVVSAVVVAVAGVVVTTIPVLDVLDKIRFRKERRQGISNKSPPRGGDGRRRRSDVEGRGLGQDSVELSVIDDEVNAETTSNGPSSARWVEVDLAKRSVNQSS